jgi:hypothetical protein
MSKSTTPRTDANKHALAHLERYGFENSLDDPLAEWPTLCEEIERELSEAREQRDTLADALRELCETLLKDKPRDITDLLNKAGKALAAAKGGTP